MIRLDDDALVTRCQQLDDVERQARDLESGVLQIRLWLRTYVTPARQVECGRVPAVLPPDVPRPPGG